MSHFSVIVIGPDVEAQLAPYHEFECTGISDQYVKDIDVTAEYRSKFHGATKTRLRGPDGALHSFFDEHGNWRPEFSQPDAGDVFDLLSHRKKKFIPSGFEEIEVPAHQVESFAEWCEGYGGQKVVLFGEQPDRDGAHKFGHTEVDAAGDVVRVIDRTNPKNKWDWYEIGGRWTGWLVLKPGAKGEIGRPGLMTDAAKPGTADVVRKVDIDFAAMRYEAGERAGAKWEIVALNASNDDDFKWDIDDGLSDSRMEFVHAAMDHACVPFAVVYKGEWSEKGSMGWWGCVSGEMEASTWNRLVNELLEGLPDDTQITVVDCHI